MRPFRKYLALALALLLIGSLCSTAFAATKADETFMQQLKKLEDYLRANKDETNLGNKAVLYLYQNLGDMHMERLARILRRYLRCADNVPLPNMLASYAAEISGGYYMSIYEYAKTFDTSPDVAADQNFYERGYLGAVIGAKIDNDKEKPEPFCPPPPPPPPYFPCCR